MTEPRYIIPGKTYLVSRRCTQRQFLLKPTPAVNKIFMYCLAYAVTNTGVSVHASGVMSNHWHVVLTDPHGKLPEFCELVHKYTAKCLNAYWQRWENLWSSEPPSYVVLTDAVDIKEAIIYTLTNPIRSHLVARVRHWPGFVSTPQDYFRDTQWVELPSTFFRPNGPMPERLPLQFTVPLAFSNISTRDFVDLIGKEIKRRENQQLRRLSREGRRVLGRKKVLTVSHLDTPESAAPHRNLNPRVAGKNKWRRFEMLKRLKSFRIAYRHALEKFKSGVRDVVFPEGTYWLKRFAGVACSPLGP